MKQLIQIGLMLVLTTCWAIAKSPAGLVKEIRIGRDVLRLDGRSDRGSDTNRNQRARRESVGRSTAKLTVMIYNVMQLPYLGSLNDWDQERRLIRLPDTLRRSEYQADVLILNEVVSNKAYRKIKELKDVYPYVTTVLGADCDAQKNGGDGFDSVTGRCSSWAYKSGVMALSKFPILETHGLVFENSDEDTWDGRIINKGAIYVKVIVNGLLVHVVGTHTQADEGKIYGGPTRILQMQELREWMGSFNIPKDEPIILAGDINTELGTKEQHEIFDGNFVFNFVDPGFGTFSSSTNWVVRAQAKHNEWSLHKEWYLDYVAIWADHLQPTKPSYTSIIKLKAKWKWFWKYLVKSKLSRNGFYDDISDHYPVVATFEFQVPSSLGAATEDISEEADDSF